MYLIHYCTDYSCSFAMLICKLPCPLKTLLSPSAIFSLDCLFLYPHVAALELVTHTCRSIVIMYISLIFFLWTPFISRVTEVNTLFSHPFHFLVSYIHHSEVFWSHPAFSWGSPDLLNVFFKFADIRVHSLC